MKRKWVTAMLPLRAIPKHRLIVLLVLALVFLALGVLLVGCQLPIKLCGDQRCDTELGETADWCPRDCRCGNGDCDANETVENCPNDCFCGDGRCQLASGESASTCSQDCAPECGNGVCEEDLDEDPWTCEADCGNSCGDGVCQPELGEFGPTCPEDCFSGR